MIRPVIMPKLGETMEEGYLVSWKKAEGDKIEKGDILFEVMSDKTNFEVESLHAGYLRKKLAEPSETPIAVTTVIGYIGDSMEEQLPAETPPSPERSAASAPAPSAQETAAVRSAGADQTGRLRASPLARRIAAERGVDLESVRGTGPGGRITERDVLAASGSQSAAPEPDAGTPSADRYTVIPWTPLRRIIAERLTASKATIPHYYLEGRIDIGQVLALKASREETTLTDFIVYFCSRAIRDFPLLNAAVVDGEIRQYETVDIGLAVSVDNGLVVPVIRRCDTISIRELSGTRRELVEKARGGRLARADMDGARFVISNLGMFGVDLLYPIINPPGVAIMGIGAAVREPVIREGSLQTRDILRISLSLDHRVVDGAYGGQFFRRLRELLENPAAAFL